jgi:hypothetical protein
LQSSPNFIWITHDTITTTNSVSGKIGWEWEGDKQCCQMRWLHQGNEDPIFQARDARELSKHGNERGSIASSSLLSCVSFSVKIESHLPLHSNLRRQWLLREQTNEN